MHLEYFQLLDRVVSIDLAARTIRTEAIVPVKSTIFEGHFPGHPLMPGVLLIEAMAQTSGWLLVAINNFDRMPFLAAVKDAKLRSFAILGAVNWIPRWFDPAGPATSQQIADRFADYLIAGLRPS